jgi:hypothetical protein
MEFEASTSGCSSFYYIWKAINTKIYGYDCPWGCRQKTYRPKFVRKFDDHWFVFVFNSTFSNGLSLKDELVLSNAMENNIYEFISTGLPNIETPPLSCKIYRNRFCFLPFPFKRSIRTIIPTIYLNILSGAFKNSKQPPHAVWDRPDT